MVYCAGGNEHLPFAKSIGVGLVEVARGLTCSILQDSPSELVFVGTCGAYSRQTPLLEIFESKSASQIELSYLQQQSYTPLDNLITLENSSLENTVNSSNYITLESKWAKQFLSLGISYENMEFFAFLQIAKFYGLPALGIFCVTNHIHKNAHEEFVAHHKDALEKLEKYLIDRYNNA